MKENHEAYFRLSEKEIEIAGPVDYVKDQVVSNATVISLFIEKLKGNIKNKPIQLKNAENDFLPIKHLENREEKYVEFEEVGLTEDVYKKYEDIISSNGTKIQILVNIPGDSQTLRMINVILIYLYIKSQLNIDSVSFDELRESCELHGELDKAHFSSYIKKNKKYFITDGTGKSSKAKITIPGKKEAERILNSLNTKN